jgi:peptidoglycan/LPS O-acetylase OafA/YrhL
MIETKRPEITDLTVCRAVFAGWVFFYHIDLYTGFSGYLGPAAGLIRSGYLGVDGFFFLSGLILARVHPDLALQPETAPNFWFRRLARIYPVHLATIAVLVVLLLTGLALGFSPHNPERFTLLSLIENLLLIYGWGVANFLAWNYPSWSVSTEWAGYLAFPILWYFIGKWDPVINGSLLAVCLTTLGAVSYFAPDGLNLTYGGALFRFFPEFCAGMMAARLVPLYADELPTKFLAYSGVALSVAGALLRADAMVAFSLLLLLHALTMQADAGRKPLFGSSFVLMFLGRLSYAFYMSFATAELLVTQYFRHENLDPAREKLFFVAAMTLLTFAYAVILHVLVEVPARRAADRRLTKPEPLAGTSLHL